MNQNTILRIEQGCLANPSNTNSPTTSSPNKFYIPGLMEILYDGQSPKCSFAVNSFTDIDNSNTLTTPTAANCVSSGSGSIGKMIVHDNVIVNPNDISATLSGSSCNVVLNNNNCSLSFSGLFSDNAGATTIISTGSSPTAVYTPITTNNISCNINVQSFGPSGSTVAADSTNCATSGANTIGAQFTTNNPSLANNYVQTSFAGSTCTLNVANSDCSTLSFTNLYSNDPGTTLATGTTQAPTNGVFYANGTGGYQTSINLLTTDTTVAHGNTLGASDIYITNAMLTPLNSTLYSYECNGAADPALTPLCISNNSLSRCSASSIGSLMNGRNCDVIVKTLVGTNTTPAKLHINSIDLTNDSNFTIVDLNGTAFTGAAAATMQASSTINLLDQAIIGIPYMVSTISSISTYGVDTANVNTLAEVDLMNATAPINQTNPQGVCQLLGS